MASLDYGCVEMKVVHLQRRPQMKCIPSIVSLLSLLPFLQGELCLQNYCNDGLSVDPSSLSPGQEFTVTAPRRVQEVAIFNATYNFCGRQSFDNGYRCILLSVNCSNATCVQQVRCKDNNDKLKNLMSYALLNLTLSFGQVDKQIEIEINESEINENEVEREIDENELDENELDENELDENELDENELDENEIDENELDENEIEIHDDGINENEISDTKNEMNEDGNDMKGECYGTIQILWNQAGEFRYSDIMESSW